MTSTAMPDWHAPWKLMRVISGHTGTCLSPELLDSQIWVAVEYYNSTNILLYFPESNNVGISVGKYFSSYVLEGLVD